ncbi:MerR family transcriptional regulator [Liquorilactobacillus satsumensis]|nr:MerR family transcriptional regulator [Liquorilactobacillus satsumensis]MCC7666459.1 MerR family transcriptional regulator [Liquorilactobacillus satsumensis]MCP9312602.1 MerR family transcriptional regulator [Liquorilactobacillus satsumensis]MCP9328908.1 MerR family transcriptional regulator [Liquorilactobacillus satsumensis]MCP9356745.1 MerR family transcriptional regulator [Liquorilactobacillus satsumensis]MCP9360359.1 MerR family transcriptional regulator [Liquorilactobacillus satsumensi
MGDKNNAAYVTRFKDIIKNEHFLFGIGDISKATGVSQRKLRYWEERGYIHPENSSDEGQHRKYSHFMFLKIAMIQSFLKEGYTLSAAVQKTNEHHKLGKAVFGFVKERLQNFTFVPGGYEIDLGEVNDTQGKHIYALIRSNKKTELFLK